MNDAPQRYQRSRQKGSRLPSNVVVVTRPTKWGNPHSLELGRAEAVRRYHDDLLAGRLAISVEDVRRELRGRGLACYCPLDGPCHADVLLTVANEQSARHNRPMRLGIAHHFGWAVAVTASADHRVVDRRRIELIEPGLPAAPIHHEGGPHLLHRRAKPLDDHALAALVTEVRASVVRATSAALAEIASALPEPIVSISLRSWPADFPQNIAIQRTVPYESRADSVMYLSVLADVARGQGWAVHLYDAKRVEAEAAHILGARAHEVLQDPRSSLGPPWTKDHRQALAATIVVS